QPAETRDRATGKGLRVLNFHHRDTEAQRPEMIVQVLSEIQARCGYLPREELHALARRLRVPLFRIQEVASFFPHYRLERPPPVRVGACRALVCHRGGPADLPRNLAERAAQIEPSQIAVEGVSCLGRCDAAPSAVSINDRVYSGLSEAELVGLIQTAAADQPLPHESIEHGP